VGRSDSASLGDPDRTPLRRSRSAGAADSPLLSSGCPRPRRWRTDRRSTQLPMIVRSCDRYAAQGVCHLRRRLGSARPLSPRTIELYRWQLRKHLLPTLGKIELRHLEASAVRGWFGHLSGPDGQGRPTEPPVGLGVPRHRSHGCTSPQGSHKPHHNSRERALRGGRSGRNVGQYVKLQVWTKQEDCVDAADTPGG
jgi:hypothetical protein